MVLKGTDKTVSFETLTAMLGKEPTEAELLKVADYAPALPLTTACALRDELLSAMAENVILQCRETVAFKRKQAKREEAIKLWGEEEQAKRQASDVEVPTIRELDRLDSFMTRRAQRMAKLAEGRRQFGSLKLKRGR